MQKVQKNIKAMTYTTTPPKVAGAYWWKAAHDHTPKLGEVYLYEGDLYFYSKREYLVKSLGGLWCRLVSAEEVRLAFEEGQENGMVFGTAGFQNYDQTRAFKIAEGLEP